MSEVRQALPAFVLWERVLRIRRQMYGIESNSVHAGADALANSVLDLEDRWEELAKKVASGETLDMLFTKWNTFDDFSDVDQKGLNSPGM